MLRPGRIGSMKIFFTLILLLVSFIKPVEIQAHAIGQPPFFKINGVYTDYYPVPSISLNEFYLPQDISKTNYLINDVLQFEIDTTAMPAPPEIIQKTKFSWDFGDGQKAQGLKNSHSYLKPGTYFLEIKADSGDGGEPQVLQSTAINILPDQNYKLPKSIIEINGKTSSDPLLDIIEVDFGKQITFDGSKSDPGSSEITEFFWDLGNQTSKTSPKFTFKYEENPYAIFPVLRIKTKDGFVSDSYVQLSEPVKNSSSGIFNKPASFDLKTIAIAAGISLVLTFAIFFTYAKLFASKSK